jgi:hypothetical protein
MQGMERLLNGARQGNAEALSALYHRFLPGIFGYIWRPACPIGPRPKT